MDWLRSLLKGYHFLEGFLIVAHILSIAIISDIPTITQNGVTTSLGLYILVVKPYIEILRLLQIGEGGLEASQVSRQARVLSEL